MLVYFGCAGYSLLCASFYLVAASVGYSGCMPGLLIVVASLLNGMGSRACRLQYLGSLVVAPRF